LDTSWLNFNEIIGLVEPGGIILAILLIVSATIVGFLIGGESIDTKKVLALGTGARNLGGAFALATSNFASNPDVLIELLVITLSRASYLVSLSWRAWKEEQARQLRMPDSKICRDAQLN
jgi:predicted Na+-dependent transporter